VVDRIGRTVHALAVDVGKCKAIHKEKNNQKTFAKANSTVQAIVEENIGLVYAKVNSKATLVLLDTGSNQTIASLRFAKEFGIPIRPFQGSAFGFNSTVTLCGTGTCLIEIIGHKKEVEVVFFKSDEALQLRSDTAICIGGNTLKSFPPITFDFDKNTISFADKPESSAQMDCHKSSKDRINKICTSIHELNKEVSILDTEDHQNHVETVPCEEGMTSTSAGNKADVLVHHAKQCHLFGPIVKINQDIGEEQVGQQE